MTLAVVKNELVIRINFKQDAVQSSTGKSLVIDSTRGFIDVPSAPGTNCKKLAW